MNFRHQIYARRVDKVNDRIDDFKDAWPEGEAVEYFIALQACKDDIGTALMKLTSRRYRRAIRNECHQRGLGENYAPKVQLDYRQFFTTEGNDDVEWSEEEIAKFKKVYAKIGPDFPRIAWDIKGKNARQCRVIYQELAEKGELPELPKLADEEEFVKRFVLSLKFSHNGQMFEVGGSDKLQQECRDKNPLPGMIDRVTGNPMNFPAMSPDGYVLDYFTWMTLLEKEGVNPFTNRPIYSKDELVLLTPDNIEEYRSQIVLEDHKTDDYYEYEEDEEEDGI